MEGMLNDLESAEKLQDEFKAKAGKATSAYAAPFALPFHTRAGRGEDIWLTCVLSLPSPPPSHPPPAVPGGIDFGVTVLTTVNWPNLPSVAIKLPPSMEECRKIFTEHYESSRSKKKLQWNYGQGTATVTTVFKGVKYELILSTLQAVVLLFFNDHAGPVGLEAIKEKLEVDEDSLKRALHSFACGKVKLLAKVPDNTRIDALDVFSINESFSDKMRKLRVPIATLEAKQDKNRVEDDRGHAIEAAVVRIMKARKTQGHAQLVSEVINQLQFFKPNPKDIKKRIEGLIEREYLERADAAQATYNYLA